eukprot:7195646-Prymnesium_polylepis.1
MRNPSAATDSRALFLRASQPLSHRQPRPSATDSRALFLRAPQEIPEELRPPPGTERLFLHHI